MVGAVTDVVGMVVITVVTIAPIIDLTTVVTDVVLIGVDEYTTDQDVINVVYTVVTVAESFAALDGAVGNRATTVIF